MVLTDKQLLQQLVVALQHFIHYTENAEYHGWPPALYCADTISATWSEARHYVDR